MQIWLNKFGSPKKMHKKVIENFKYLLGALKASLFVYQSSKTIWSQ